MDRALAGELSVPIARAFALEDAANAHHFIESDRAVRRVLFEVKPHRRSEGGSPAVAALLGSRSSWLVEGASDASRIAAAWHQVAEKLSTTKRLPPGLQQVAEIESIVIASSSPLIKTPILRSG